MIWTQFKKNKIALAALFFFLILSFIGIYAPFFASSKPIVVLYHKKIYFPLFRYLFYPGFFSKPIDLFFNVLMVTLPLFFLGLAIIYRIFKKRGVLPFCVGALMVQFLLTSLFAFGLVKDPARNLFLVEGREKQEKNLPDFERDFIHYNAYEKLNLILAYKQKKAQSERLKNPAQKYFSATNRPLPLLFEMEKQREGEELKRLQTLLQISEEEYQKALASYPHLVKNTQPLFHQLETLLLDPKVDKEKLAEASKEVESAKLLLQKVEKVIDKYRYAQSRLQFLDLKNKRLENESQELHILIPTFFRSFHWEEDAGGGQASNPYLPWHERSRLNQKDLASALIFGIRISLIVGLSAVFLSLIIGLPLGLFAGYFAGKADMIILRFIEIWEAMPTFFTLLLISAMLHTKSLFLTVIVLGMFGWTSFTRYTRAEVLRERNLPYVMASKSLGFKPLRIIFSDIMPNSITPVLALLPFAMMGAITAEAGLSFLGLGEEGSTSLGVLMSEARSLFPGESYLLWPPALLLTLLLVSIALVGDGLRDALDPKTHFG